MSYDWRYHPTLVGRFHPDCPDDIQAVVHDGGPRFTDRTPEIVWVRITGMSQQPFGPVFTARVLNQPHNLQTVAQDQTVQLLAPDEFTLLVMATDRYLADRAEWSISYCPSCGLSELFDAPSELQRKIFPQVPADAVMETFTTFCPACRQVMIVSKRKDDEPYVKRLEVNADSRQPFQPPPAKRKWWQFWR
jgi:hypothetical protein